MKNYKLNQIFEGNYPPEAALWCNENHAYIEEIEEQDGACRFQIVGIPEPTEEEKAAVLWNNAYEILDLVKSGTVEIPTEELIEMLPKLETIYE